MLLIFSNTDSVKTSVHVKNKPSFETPEYECIFQFLANKKKKKNEKRKSTRER